MSAESTVPATQTAVVQSAYGLPRDVLTVSTSHPVTAPGAHHVQVRVMAASINPVDVKILHGNLHIPGIMSVNFPHTPGQDFSGVVTAVGPSVTRLKVGDEVWGVSKDKGTFAEYVNAHEAAVSHKPPSLSFTDAATFPLAAMTALQALERVDVPNAKVVIIGASGGVGLFAVQIAKILGASSVVGVCSGDNAQLVKSFGADSTIDYKSTKLSEAITDKSVDVILDCVGGKEQYQEAEKVVKSKGRFITLVGDNTETKISVGSVLTTMAQAGARKLSGKFTGGPGYILHLYTPTVQSLDALALLVKDKGLKTNIDNSFNLNLEGVVGLYTQSEGKRTKGKLVLEVVPGAAASTSTSSTTTTTTSSTSAAATSTASTSSSSSTATAASSASSSTPAAGTVASSISSVPTSTAIVPNATAEHIGVASTDVSTGSIVEAKVEPVPAPTSEGALSQAAPITNAPVSDAPVADAPLTDAPVTDAPAATE